MLCFRWTSRWWLAEQGHLIFTDRIKHRCGSLYQSLGHVLVVLVLACLLYFTYSLNYSWISNISVFKNQEVFTFFHEWISHIFKYTNLSGKFDLCRCSMLIELEIGPGSFPCTSIQAILSSNCTITLTSFGPATIQRNRAFVFCNKPTAPLSFFTNLLFCSLLFCSCALIDCD